MAPLRPVAAEIIVAANSLASDEDLGEYATVADVLLRYEYSGADRQWPWLLSQARGDWILILDGDELISDRFLAALPALTADRRVSQYLTAIHWAWQAPDVPGAPIGRLLDEPWRSDRRLRLLRNDGRLSFAGHLHHLAQAAPPVAYRDDLAVYHLDLLLPDFERRRAKVEQYETQRFGMLTPAGHPFNPAFYLPELRPSPPLLSAIPDGDLARIEDALAAVQRQPPLAAEQVPLISRERVLRHLPGAETTEPGQHADLALTALSTFVAGRRDNEVWLEVTHRGTVPWQGTFGSGPTIKIDAGWKPVEGGAIQHVNQTPLPHALAPGESLTVPLYLAAPSLQGPADLVIGISDGVRRFDSPVTTRVEVLPRATQLLANASRDGGGLVSLEAAMRIRQGTGRQDALHCGGPNADDTTPPPVDSALASMVALSSLPVCGIDGPTVDRLAELIRATQPSSVLLLGSGVGTLVLARLLADQGTEASLLSIDEDRAVLDQVHDALNDAGLADQVTLLHAPVDAPAWRQQLEYAFPDALRQALLAAPPELVVIDGPRVDTGATRRRSPQLLQPFLLPGTRLVLNDAFLDAELSVAQEWAEREDLTLLGFTPTPRGLLEATVGVSAPPLVVGASRRVPWRR